MDSHAFRSTQSTHEYVGISPTTRALVHLRAHELAAIAGHVAPHVSQDNYEQATRELQGGPAPDGHETALEAIPESERWDPVPGSAGHQARVSPSEDEDYEGRSETEQLFDIGVGNAMREQLRRAAHQAAHPEGNQS